MYEDFIPERIAQLRINKGVSARDMSLSLGQSENYINMIENKKSLPSMTVFFYICEFFNVTPQEFFEQGNSNPATLNDIIEDLKRLDDNAISSLSGLIKELARRK